MKESIGKRLEGNLDRVRNLVELYKTYFAGKSAGRKGYLETDVLRAAIVFLHASLEDFLRSLAYWKLPEANESVIKKIPIVGKFGQGIKFELDELVKHRGKTVDDLIKESVNGYLERSNYGNTKEISKLLQDVGINPESVNKEFASLSDLMERRHQIVHRADQKADTDKQHSTVRSINAVTVEKWLKAVEVFTEAVINEINP